jgi:signal transduction histidine kinase
MSSTTIGRRKHGISNSSRMTATLDLELWDRTSDGLIFFDSRGHFLDCSLKLQRTAGSAEAARAAFAELRWPREFAAGGELVSASRHPIAFAAGEAEVLCARTADGIVAALRLLLAGGMGKRPGRPERDLVHEIFSAQIGERRALSRHLHGVLTQDLVALSLSLSGLREEGNAALAEAMAYVDRCCRGVRALSYVLAPPTFLGSGLIETIQWYAGVLSADAAIDFEVKAPALAADPPEEIKDLFFAGLQQIAGVAIWHSGSAAIRAEVTYQAGMVSICIECACPPDAAVRESPLIRERARALGGWTRFTTNRKKTSLEIAVPWNGTE